MWKLKFADLIKSPHFETPWVRKNGYYSGVCLSVGPLTVVKNHMKHKKIYFATKLCEIQKNFKKQNQNFLIRLV